MRAAGHLPPGPVVLTDVLPRAGRPPDFYRRGPRRIPTEVIELGLAGDGYFGLADLGKKKKKKGLFKKLKKISPLAMALRMRKKILKKLPIPIIGGKKKKKKKRRGDEEAEMPAAAVAPPSFAPAAEASAQFAPTWAPAAPMPAQFAPMGPPPEGAPPGELEPVPAQAGIGMPMGTMGWLVVLGGGGLLAWTMMRPKPKQGQAGGARMFRANPRRRRRARSGF